MRVGKASESTGWRLDSPLEVLPGMGPLRAATWRERGVSDLGGLLRFLPKRHRARLPVESIASARSAGSRSVAIEGIVRSYRSGRGRKSPARLLVADATDGIEVVLYQMRRVPSAMRHGATIRVEGRITRDDRAPATPCSLNGAHFQAGEDLLDRDPLVGEYELPDGIPPRVHRRWIQEILRRVEDEIQDWRTGDEAGGPALPALPSLPCLHEAIRIAHSPRSSEDLERARRRLAFEEFAAVLYPLLRARETSAATSRVREAMSPSERETLASSLPFELTRGQRAALDAILDDLERARPMHRLLHGEVGSGKTAVALLAMLACVRQGRSAALLAPTAVLANQHAMAGRDLLAGSGVSIHAITGGTSAQDERAILERLRVEGPSIVVGTMRLLPWVDATPSFGLAVIDEQQRFGVSQRARMRRHGEADLLVMTATPIPRTLTLALYGDLDVSVIEEVPKGRARVTTRRVLVSDSFDLAPVVDIVRTEVEAEGRVFVVCPQIGESKREAAAVTRVASDLKRALPHLAIAVAHGRRSPADNDLALESFRSGRVVVLVSTVLIEVGIDVPAATCMVVLDAERFGLAQLHQLRGRVGRGSRVGSCVLVSVSQSELATSRLDALVRHPSGFEVAEADLLQRGCGEIFGDAQHGFTAFTYARLPRDADLLAAARTCVLRRLRDPALPARSPVPLIRGGAEDAVEAVAGPG